MKILLLLLWCFVASSNQKLHRSAEVQTKEWKRAKKGERTKVRPLSPRIYCDFIIANYYFGTRIDVHSSHEFWTSQPCLNAHTHIFILFIHRKLQVCTNLFAYFDDIYWMCTVMLVLIPHKCRTQKLFAKKREQNNKCQWVREQCVKRYGSSTKKAWIEKPECVYFSKGVDYQRGVTKRTQAGISKNLYNLCTCCIIMNTN